MNTRRALLIAGYIACVFAVVPYVDGLWAPWITALISTVFAMAFAFLASGSVATSLGIIFTATTFVPVVLLVAIGVPHYSSFKALLDSYISTSLEHNQLWGFEIALPTAIAGLALIVAGRMRSNITLDSDARKSGARGSM
jgi:glycerol-3-phosphate acyltransferase PlsY